MNEAQALVPARTVRTPSTTVRALAASSVNELPEYLTAEEARAMIEAAETDRDRLLLETLWQSGARASEVVELRVADVRPPMQLRLPNRKRRKAAEKTVYVSEGLIAALALYALGAKLGHADRIFPIGMRRLEQIVHAAAVKAGIYKIWDRHGAAESRPAWAHLFRHGSAINLIQQTGRLDIVQDNLGHADLNSTKVYLRVTSAEKQQAIRGVRY